MLLENGCALCDGQLDSCCVARLLMCGEAHDQPGIPGLEQVDLIQVEVFGHNGVFRNTMQQREILPTMLEEAHDVVDVIKRCTTTRCNYRPFDKGDAFKERPIGERATSDLDDVIVMPFDEIHRCLIERRTH